MRCLDLGLRYVDADGPHKHVSRGVVAVVKRPVGENVALTRVVRPKPRVLALIKQLVESPGTSLL